MALNHRNKLANKDRLEHLYEFYGNTVLIDINDSITETSLFSNFFFNKFIFSGYFDLELSCRQYLIIHLMGLNFNAELLRTYNGKTITKLSYPLPVQWIRIIENRGVKVNSISCSLKFYQFIIIQLFKSIVFFLKEAWIEIAQLNRQDSKIYSYFIDLNKYNIPCSGSKQELNTINWYINWKSIDIEAVFHNVNCNDVLIDNILIKEKKLLPVLNDFSTKMCFIFWFFSSFFRALFDLLRGNWTSSILLCESIKLKKFKLAHKNQLAKEYLFSLSSLVYRPIWTFEAERKNSNIIMYNYAASFSPFTTLTSSELGFKIMNWPRIINWSEYYLEYTRKVCIKKDIIFDLANFIHFSDSSNTFVLPEVKCISVFDVSPYNEDFYYTTFPVIDYRNYEIAVTFLKDIYEAAQTYKIPIIYKSKRSFNKNHCERYINFINQFKMLPGVITVNPDVSPYRLIEKSTGSISIPFTSTAVIGKKMNKISIFYDPTSNLIDIDLFRQDICVVSGKNELTNWMKNLLN